MKRVLKLGLALVLAMTVALIGCKHETVGPEPAPTPTSYAVGISAGIENGIMSADKQTAQKDETVTLTLIANAGYKFGSISVKDASNNTIGTTTITAGTSFTFVMPESNVTVNATLVLEGITGSEVFIEGRAITIRSTLWACDHEVTQTEYQAIMGTNPSVFTSSPADGEAQGNRPVEFVSWYDCLVYCNKRSISEGLTPCYTIGGKTNPTEWGDVPTLSDETWDEASCNFDANGYRLPTEAEWEYLARGGNMTNSGQKTFSGSDSIDDVAWYKDNSGSKTHEVKKKAPNTLGLYDMSGNVWEWCWDRHGSITVDTPSVGASSGYGRVLRAGSWTGSDNFCRVAQRYGYDPSSKNQYFGFRLVRSVD